MKNLNNTKPGDYIEAYLDKIDKTQQWLASSTNYSRASINHAIKGRKKIDAELAQKLSKNIGESPQYWLNLQRDYELGTLAPPIIERSSKRSIDNKSINEPESEINTLIRKSHLIIEEINESFIDKMSYKPAPLYIEIMGELIDYDENFTFQRHSKIKIQTKEHFILSNSIHAEYELIGDLADAGVLVSSSRKIPSGFRGYLNVTLVNCMDEDLEFFEVYEFIDIQFAH